MFCTVCISNYAVCNVDTEKQKDAPGEKWTVSIYLYYNILQ